MKVKNSFLEKEISIYDFNNCNSTLTFFENDGVKNQWEANFAQSAIPFRIEDMIEYRNKISKTCRGRCHGRVQYKKLHTIFKQV
jgi:hypothetical protein